MSVLCADVAVVGGGLGGIAAALAAADAGASVVLTEAEPIVGGQVTSQLVSPLDEHPLVETTGTTASYRRFRELVRAEYGGVANPGGGWVSRLCFEPAVGLRVLNHMLDEHVAAGRIRVLTGTRPVAADVRAGLVRAVEHEDGHGSSVRIEAHTFADATELGDLLPLTGARWIVGSEGTDAFGEEHAVPGAADPLAEQSCTWVAAVVLEPSPSPVGDPPRSYNRLRDAQPFSLSVDGWDGIAHRYRFACEGPDGRPPFWTYRRVRDAERVGGSDAAVLNWAGNDYAAAGLVADPARARREARELTCAFLHWLRAEAPRDDGGRGYPELRLAPEAALSADGLALAPYVRESRRLLVTNPVTEHHLVPVAGAERARPLPAPVGVAWYHADLHPRVGHSVPVYAQTAPFQVPLNALVAGQPRNLVAAAKNLAATQVAAAAYRVHPGEWALGEAAGALAAHAAGASRSTAALAEDRTALLALQLALLQRGAPLVWSTDLVPDHPAFVSGQLLAAAGGLVGQRARELATRPDEPAGPDDISALRRAAQRLGVRSSTAPGGSWGQVATALVAPLLRRPSRNPRQSEALT